MAHCALKRCLNFRQFDDSNRFDLNWFSTDSRSGVARANDWRDRHAVSQNRPSFRVWP